MFLFTSAVCNFTKLTSYNFFLFFSFEIFFDLFFSAYFYQFSDLILSNFNGNVSHLDCKDAKIFNRIKVQVFHYSNFYPAFFHFFGLIGFGLYYIGFLVSFCVFQRAKKVLRVSVCVLRLRGT